MGVTKTGRNPGRNPWADRVRAAMVDCGLVRTRKGQHSPDYTALAAATQRYSVNYLKNVLTGSKPITDGVNAHIAKVLGLDETALLTLARCPPPNDEAQLRSLPPHERGIVSAVIQAFVDQQRLREVQPKLVDLSRALHTDPVR